MTQRGGGLLLKADVGDQMSGVGGFSLNRQSRVLAKTGLCEDKLRSSRSQPRRGKGCMETDSSFVTRDSLSAVGGWLEGDQQKEKLVREGDILVVGQDRATLSEAARRSATIKPGSERAG